MTRFALIGLLLTFLGACASAPPADEVSKTGEAGGEEAGEVAEAVELAEELGLMEMVSAGVEVRDDDYRIGPADELDIEVFQVEELSTTEKVNARGYIRMPLVGNIKVAGLTAYEAEDLLVERYKAEYLRDPQIYVNITHYASQRVTVIGSVQEPGIYPLTGPTTLMKALAFAGGPTRLANEEEVVIFRTRDDGKVIGYLANYAEIAAGLKPDPEIIGNDRIVVDASASKTFIEGISQTLRGFIGFRVF